MILVLILPLWHLFHRFVKQNKTSDSNSLPGGKSASEKQRQKRGSWGGSACQMADLMLLNYFLMYILLLYFTTSPWLSSCSFLPIDNNRSIQHTWFGLPKRVPHVGQVEQQCGARLPLRADRGQCICDTRVWSWCWLMGNQC